MPMIFSSGILVVLITHNMIVLTNNFCGKKSSACTYLLASMMYCNLSRMGNIKHISI